MDNQSYFLFLSIAIAYIASPGPAVFLAINYGAIHGLKKTIFTLLGNTTGLGILAFISAIGIGAIIVNSIYITNFIKILGAMMLLYIGIKMIISSRKAKVLEVKTFDNRKKTMVGFYKEGLLLSLSNPKPIIFFASIYPQFINFNNEATRQFFLLGVTFMVISLLCLVLYALVSKYTIGKVLDERKVRLFNLGSGVVFIFMAFLLIYYDVK